VPDPQYLGYVTPRLSDAHWPTLDVPLLPGPVGEVRCGHEVDLAKKMFHRGDRATARDLFDLAMVVEREPDALQAAAPFLVRHRDRFLEQIRQPGAGFVATFEAIAATGYRPSLEHCIAVATAYLAALGDR